MRPRKKKPRTFAVRALSSEKLGEKNYVGLNQAGLCYMPVPWDLRFSRRRRTTTFLNEVTKGTMLTMLNCYVLRGFHLGLRRIKISTLSTLRWLHDVGPFC